GTRPVFAFDFADPYVLRVGDTYYGYSTNAGTGDIQVAKSSDLHNWVFVGNALAALPKWAAPNATWAPSVLPRPTTTGMVYVAYYTTQNGRDGPHCIGRAVAAAPEGPFVDDTPNPMICPRRADAIDLSPFVDSDGTAYLTGAEPTASRRSDWRPTDSGWRATSISSSMSTSPGRGRWSRDGRWCTSGGGTSSSTRATTGARATTPSGTRL